MARTDLAIQAPGSDGITPAFVAVDNANGMQFTPSNRTVLYLKASGAITLTFRMPGTAAGVAFVNGGKQVVVGGAGERAFSLRDIGLFQQPNTNGLVFIDFTTGAGTIAAFEGGVAG